MKVGIIAHHHPGGSLTAAITKVLAEANHGARMNDRDKIEELEETVRQQRELLAPPCAFPLEWKLSPTQSRLLGALCRSGELTTEAATISAGVDGEATSQEVVRQHVCRMRVKLKRHGIRIGRTYSVGYYLEPDSLRAARVAFRPALRVEN